MTNWEALLLGIVQGITEFLPISSDGHLTVVQALFGYEDLHSYLLFDLVCHLGTLLAVFVVFWSKIKQVASGADVRTLLQLFVATLPLGLILFFGGLVEKIFNSPWLLGYFFSFTALLLLLQHYFGYEDPERQQRHGYRNALLVGLSQFLAVLPGVSRSGTTISVARLLGWPRQEAVTFSFLMAIPAILGGLGYEMTKALWHGSSLTGNHIGLEPYLIGFGASVAVGYLSLKALIVIVNHDILHWFAPYCLAIALFSFYYFH